MSRAEQHRSRMGLMRRIGRMGPMRPIIRSGGAPGSPMPIPTVENDDRVINLLFFLDGDPRESWDRFRRRWQSHAIQLTAPSAR